MVVIFYHPFDQPIIADRAYLLYMSQVVFRNESLYSATTFGYTPLSVIIVGYAMKLGSLFSINTIESARIMGLLLYGIISGSLFILLKNIFRDNSAPWIGMTFFIGLAYVQIISGVNAEPKLFVLAFSIIGMYFFLKKNWLMVGLCFSAAAMCWHVSVVSLVACAAVLPWKSVEIKSSILKFIAGIAIGTLPVLLYLTLTDGWLYFYDQAILRKLVVEGESIGENPFRWLIKSISPKFITETIHFVIAFVGFFLLVKHQFSLRKNDSKIFKNVFIIPFLIAYGIIWSIFNTIEFQGPADIIPLLVLIIISVTYVMTLIKSKIHLILFWALLISYNFFDTVLYKVPFTYTQEKKLVSNIHSKYGDPFVVGFEEYYVVSEKPMPSKYMRMAPYEDYFLMRNNACHAVGEILANTDYSIIFNSKKGFKVGECADRLLYENTTLEEVDSFNFKNQNTYISDTYAKNRHYSILKTK